MTVGRGVFDQNRFDEMERLRFIEKWSITKIGIFFGVSRQRIHQILGSTGYLAEKPLRPRGVSHSQDVQEARDLIGNETYKSPAELVEETGYSLSIIAEARKDIRCYSQQKMTLMGMKVEDYVSEVLTANGIQNTLAPHSRPYDITLANGKTIEVKSRHKPHKSNSENFYFFVFKHALKKQKPNPDFYIFAIVRDEIDLFVVPAKALGVRTALGFVFPKSKKSRKNSMRQYHNRFDLLQSSAR